MKAKISFLFVSVVMCFGNPIVNSAAAQGTDATFNFDNDEVGKLPADWTPAVSTWIIAADGTNKALKQTGKSEGDRFNICVQNKLK